MTQDPLDVLASTASADLMLVLSAMLLGANLCGVVLLAFSLA